MIPVLHQNHGGQTFIFITKSPLRGEGREGREPCEGRGCRATSLEEKDETELLLENG